ncbi:TetR/AcrR family transcriptional regulator [Lysinimonas soli]|uniref:TetR/AcrR family transcriptional regulator n=1 Tax=Lysinimonas soli TaxID=1074233 RepID=A0ABW0NNI0_9MICO
MPRAGLSREAVTELAVELVDSTPDGFDGLTLAAVAGRAGVAVPSLYKHVGSLADLRRSVALVGMAELLRRSTASTEGRVREDALRALGRAIRRFAAEHPGLYAATQIAPRFEPGDGDVGDPVWLALAQAATDTVDVVSSVLLGFGLPEQRTVDAVRATRAAIHGFVELEAHGGFGMPDDVDRSFEALLDVLVAGIAQLARN